MNTQLELDWGEEFQFVASSEGETSMLQMSEQENMTTTQSSDSLVQSSEALNDGQDAAVLNGVGALNGTEPVSQPSADQDNPAQRILALEQALDQCQSYIDELKVQLSDQAFLEAQLAATEEFSHIQKQAIVTLKTRLSQETTVDPGELETLQQQQAQLETDLDAAQSQLQTEQTKTGTLQTQLQQEQQVLKDAQAEVARLAAQIELSQDSAVQETQQRIIAQTTAERLRNSLRDREETLQTLEAQLQRANENVIQQQAVIEALQNTSKSDSHKNRAIQNLSSTLLKAQTEINRLEAQTSQQAILHAQFQHSTHEMEAKANSYQERTEQLETQVAEMQEQILHQAQQAREYETAVQHWKDRCGDAEQTVAQLRGVLSHLLCDRKSSEPLSEQQLDTAISEIAASLPDPIQDTETAEPRKNLKLDLPAIMNRWRSSKP